jgi:hypothetical protein
MRRLRINEREERNLSEDNKKEMNKNKEQGERE